MLLQKKIESISIKTLYPKSYFLAFFAFFVIYNITFYMNMRSQWIWSKGNDHLEAKEHFVSGQVLYGFRKILNQMGMHPENILMKPLTVLQEIIYEQGKLHLPKDDAEVSVWHYEWFAYPYSRRDLVPYSLEKDDLSEMQKLLDETWHDIENMMELKIADTGIKERSSELLPAAMMYYTGRDKHYKYGMYEKVPWRLGLAQDTRLVERYKKIVTWAESLKKNDYKYKGKEITPLSFGAMLVAKNDSLERIIMGEIYERSFTCENPYLEQFYDSQKEFSGGISQELWEKHFKQWSMYHDIISKSRGAVSIVGIFSGKCNFRLATPVSKFQIKMLLSNPEYRNLYEMVPYGSVSSSLKKKDDEYTKNSFGAFLAKKRLGK